MIAAVVLAGGRATRMGQDKALATLGEATLLDHVVRRLANQAAPILLNANGDPARFARFDLPVVPDTLADQPGPLAGVLAAMLWLAAHRPDVADLLSVPVDCPFLPEDLAARLLAERGSAELACAASLGRVHPVVALWPVRLAAALQAALTQGVRRVDAIAQRHGAVHVAFSAEPVDPFLN